MKIKENKNKQKSKYSTSKNYNNNISEAGLDLKETEV